MNNPSVICLMGLTGTGKTKLAMQIYDALPVELISVDSAMIYKGMDIGTAKPAAEELAQYPHHLIDIIEPFERYSAANFAKDALQLIADIHKRGRRAVLVGGTMLYFKALQQGLNELPESTKESKFQLNQELEALGLDALYNQLRDIDPLTAARLNENDPQRIMRALEVYRLSGKRLSAWLLEEQQKPSINFLNLALIPSERTKLHKILAQRFEQMLSLGFEKEVQALQMKKIPCDSPALRSVGYKQMLDYLDGHIDYEQMQQQAIAATRQLAKRQHTWLKKWPNLIVCDPWDPRLLQTVMPFIMTD